MVPSVGNRTFVTFPSWNTSYFNIEVTSSKVRFCRVLFRRSISKRVLSDIVHVLSMYLSIILV